MITHTYERHDTPTSLTDAEVAFVQVNDGDPGEVYLDQRIELDREDYEAMGEPESIRVVITPATPPAARTGEDDEADLITVRFQFCDAISGVSEERWSAGWHIGIVEQLRREGGLWLRMAHAAGGWPVGYRGEDGWDPLTEAELAALSARPLVSGPVMCCTLGHENVPAVALGTYDDGDAVATNVAYCDPCALAVAGSYRVTQMLDARPLVSGTENRDDVAGELARHQHLMGRRDDDQPQWFSWCECGWDGGPVEPSRGAPVDVRMAFRLHVADKLLALLGGDQAAGLTETKETDR